MRSRVVVMALLTFPQRDPNADVLVVTSGWPHADNPTYCVFIERQVKALHASGIRSDVLFINGYRSATAYIAAAALLAWWTLTGRRRYRLVHAQTGEAALAAGFFRRAPLLVTYYGDDLLGTRRRDDSFSLLNRLKTGLIRQHSRLAKATITQSLQMENALPSAVRRRNEVLPNGVDTSVFRPLDRDEARKRLGWPLNERVALFLASPAVACKRYWLAEAATAVAVRTFPNLRLHVGTGVPPADVPVVINASDCLLLTSSSEGSPNVVKEAVMCDLPVVTTKVGDVEDVLRDVKPSRICEDSPEALAEGIIDCVRQPLRSNGRSASEWLQDDAITKRLLSVYRQVIQPSN
jgi:teichuronic acid biosynthesis glycosyltransferase TuaC